MVGLHPAGLAGLVILALLIPTRSNSVEPCVARASVVPKEAFVGQQVLYILHIEQRRDVTRVRFQPPLSFPSLRSEWLPTVRLPDPDEGTRAYEERRALHPGHVGVLHLPEAGLLCETPAGSQLIRVPPLTLRVRAVPEVGRPPKWSGTIGPVELHWRLTPDRVALGGTVRLGVRIEGPGSVWREDPGIERMLPPGDADIFPLEPETLRDKGRSLNIRHYRSYDVVPRRTGEIVFPGLKVVSFDPETERFQEHVLPDLVLQVVKATSPAGDPLAAGRLEDAKIAPVKERQPATPGPAASASGESKLPFAWLGLALALAIGALLLRRLTTRPADASPSAQRLLSEAEAFLHGGDAAEGAKALARCISSLAIRATGAPELALLEQRLERARFANDLDLDELRAVASELGAWLAAGGTR